MSVVDGTPLFTREDHGTEPHQLVILSAEGPEWLEHLAGMYRDLRGGTQIAPAPLTLDGVEILDVDAVKRRFTNSQISARAEGNFDVIRSDLGEIVLNYIGSELGGYGYGYQSIRDRELAGSPGRSIDQIGVRKAVGADGTSRVELMLGEAKVSSQTASPPTVVDSKKDSLSKSHLKQLAEIGSTTGKIVHAYRFCVDQEMQNLFGVAALMFETAHPNLVVHATSVLMRPSTSGAVTDFGSYASNPDQFGDAVVDFYIVRASGDDLEALVDTFAALIADEQDVDEESEVFEEFAPDDVSTLPEVDE